MTDATTDPVTDLDSPKASIRQSAVDTLAAQGGPNSATRISGVLLHDSNANLRLHCAELLGQMGEPAAEGLLKALREETEPFVRVRIAGALSQLHLPAVVPNLAESACGDKDDRVREGCCAALLSYKGDDATRALIAALSATHTSWLKARIARLLGEAGDRNAVAAIQPLLGDRDDGIVRAAIGATANLDPSALVAAAPKLLAPETNPKVRRACVERLGQDRPAGAVNHVVESLVTDTDPGVRDSAADALAKFEDPEAEVDLVLQVAARAGGRVGLPCVAILRGLQGAVGGDTTQIVPLLLERAPGAPTVVTGVIADLIVAAFDGDPSRAAAEIDAYDRAHNLEPAALQALRIEVGGQQALDPILAQLREDLRVHFQEPIHELNQRTTDSWNQAIQSAQRAFVIRTAMSIGTFLIGVGLIITSVVLFATGSLTATEAAGSGVSLAGGLVATLLTVYRGPLKDIRQSISDLGSANVAFIGFVHQVLQVSHTFTAAYQQGTMTFDKAKEASEIITAATESAAALLSTSGTPHTKTGHQA